MIEIRGNLFAQNNADAIAITTNGFVKKNGEAVMGKGCAKQAANMMPSLPKILGKKIREAGNVTQILVDRKNRIPLISFPVKPIMEISNGNNYVSHMNFPKGKSIPGWACLADADIIVKSANELVKLADERGWNKIVIPRPGCGAGELSWDEIKPLLDKILDDRFYSITF